jgi:hypothetical protein
MTKAKRQNEKELPDLEKIYGQKVALKSAGQRYCEREQS